MKICKKCKKKVANKAKICPNCGSDVSKLKIIENKAKKPDLKKENSKKSTSAKEFLLTEIEKPEEQNEVKKTKKTKYEKMILNKNKTSTVKKQTKSSKKSSVTPTELEKKKEPKSKINIKVIKTTLKKNKKESNKNSKSKKEKKDVKNKHIIATITYKTRTLFKKIKENIKKANEKLKTSIKNNKEKNIKRKEEKLKQQEILKIEKNKQQDNNIVEKGKSIEEPLVKKIVTDENTTNLGRTKKIIDNLKTELLKEEDEEYVEEKQNKNKIFNKTTFLIFVISIILITAIISGYQLIALSAKSNAIEITEDKYGSIYEINQKILYDGMIYQINEAKVVEPTEYKKPKEGYQFIQVSITLENKSDDKKKYTYKSFKIKNSKDEETLRIFTPINATTSLYSGTIVVGAQKTGSLIFEEPIDEESMLMNFYKINETKNETTGKTETNEILIFSVNLGKALIK